MKYLLTGAAGFIGFHLCDFLLKKYPDVEIVGLDNINAYYDTDLKFGRLSALGIERDRVFCGQFTESILFPAFRFIRMSLEDDLAMEDLFKQENFDIVIHLAAQAGVRYSIENPRAYIKSNVDGFLNILEGARHNNIKHLVYASSSSVYGLNAKIPFSEKDGIAHPASLYAATKKSNELMAHTYSHLYRIPTTGLRFFTVYGPWGRPDMSPFIFTDAILNDRPINIFNNGDMLRDFTYIDDIVEGIAKVIHKAPQASKEWDNRNPDPSYSSAPYRIYNIGNERPIQLMDFISAIEGVIGKESKKIFLPMQKGDVYQTFADTSSLQTDFGYKPKTNLNEGIKKTIDWFRAFYNI